MLFHCDSHAIAHPPSIPSPNTATYPSTPSVRTRVAIHRAGQPALMNTHDHIQEAERNVSFRASFLRSTLFCAPFRCGSNPGWLPVKLSRMPRAPSLRPAFVLLRPYSPISRPTLVFPPVSSGDAVETGITKVPADVVELLNPAHTIARIGCTGMLALLSTLGRRKMM